MLWKLDRNARKRGNRIELPPFIGLEGWVKRLHLVLPSSCSGWLLSPCGLLTPDVEATPEGLGLGKADVRRR